MAPGRADARLSTSCSDSPSVSRSSNSELALRAAPSRTGLQQLGAGQAEDQDRRATHALGQVLDQVEQGGLRPVDVLEHDHPGPLARDRLQQPAEGPEDLLDAGCCVDPAGRLGDPLDDQLRVVLARKEVGEGVGGGETGDDLPHRPERDALAVRVQMTDEVDEAVTYCLADRLSGRGPAAGDFSRSGPGAGAPSFGCPIASTAGKTIKRSRNGKLGWRKKTCRSCDATMSLSTAPRAPAPRPTSSDFRSIPPPTGSCTRCVAGPQDLVLARRSVRHDPCRADQVAARVLEMKTRLKVALPSCYPHQASRALLADRARKLPCPTPNPTNPRQRRHPALRPGIQAFIHFAVGNYPGYSGRRKLVGGLLVLDGLGPQRLAAALGESASPSRLRSSPHPRPGP